jgi:uncharacterized protein DUF87/helicase HerA-like protein
MKGPIPPKALEQHIAVLGKTGSGKSYAVRGAAVEPLLDDGARVCVVDPTGAWYGLRSSASGTRAGYPVVIFGGNHADLPLGGAHGEAIAEVIGTSSTPSILDTSLMKVGERTRFFADFADSILRKNKGPLHLVIDEAHLFMPQGKVNDPQSGAMLHAANNMVSLGRSRGLRIILITQRPAKLHKDSLTQAETLIALRLIAPQDRAAVEAWIEDNADEKKAREIISSLATLKTGHGWIWAPELDVLERVQFPKIRTYDSGRAPDGSAAEAAKVLAPIDREAIAARLQSVSAAALADDPKRLRARIAELERNAKTSGATVSKEDLQKAEDRGYQKGTQDAQRAAAVHLKSLRGAVHQAIENALSAAPAPAQIRPTPVPAPRQTTPTRPQSNGHAEPVGDLTGPEQRILNALAWLESTTGVPECEQPAVAFLAGYTFGAGGFNNPKSHLNVLGLIEYVSGRMRLTDAGRAAAAPPAEALTAEELHSRVLNRLPGPEQRILKPVLEVYPEPIAAETVAEKAGYTFGSGGFNNPRSRLRTLGLIEYVSGGLKAADALFPTR